MRNGYRLTDGFIADFTIPLTANLRKSQTAIELIQNDPDHDARALERGLTAADFRIRYDVPSQFDPAVLSISLRFHAAAPHYASTPILLQAASPHSAHNGCFQIRVYPRSSVVNKKKVVRKNSSSAM